MADLYKGNLTEGSITGTMLRFAFPLMLGNLLQQCYNVADTLIVGRVLGADALAAVGSSYALIVFVTSIFIGLCMGCSAVFSMQYGAREFDGLRRSIFSSMLIVGGVTLVLNVASLLWLTPVIRLLQTPPELERMVFDYLFVVFLGMIPICVYNFYAFLLRAVGNSVAPLYFLLMSVVLNIGLDLALMLWLDMGVEGAAWATVIGQVVSLIYVMVHFMRKSSLLHFKRGMFKFDSKIAKNIISIGLGPFLINSFACLIVMLINTGLKNHGGDLYISAYGILNRTIVFFTMIIMGFNQGMQPIVGYNFGAHKIDRVKQTYKYTLICAISINSIGFVICQFFPDLVIRMFTDYEELIGISRHAIRIVSSTLPLIAFQMVSTSFFQSMGYAKKAIFLSTNRQLLFLIPFLLILPNYYGAEGVWWSIPSADVVAVCVSFVMIMLQFRKFKKAEAAQPEQS